MSTQIQNLLRDFMVSTTPPKFRFQNANYYYRELERRRWFKPWRICWSKHRNANGKFLSWVYEYQSRTKQWKMRWPREHRRKKDARKRALHFENRREQQIQRNKEVCHEA